MWRNHHVFMAEAGESGAGGGGGGSPAAGGDASPAAPAAATPGAGDGGQQQTPAAIGTPASNVLAAGAGASPAGTPGTPAAAAPAGPFGAIPEKFQVKAADGTPDLPASWAKVEEHRAHLEKRLGAGDIPPKTADEYKVNIPEALAEKIKGDELAKDASFKEMLGKAHVAGMSQKQVDFMVGEFLDRSMKLQAGMNQLTADDCTGKLREAWKTEAEFKVGVSAAYRASAAYGDVDKLMAKYGNDPDFIQLMAKVGSELSEDRGTPNGGQSISEVDAESLAKSPAYWNPNDPKHAETKAKVQAFYDKKYGATPKQSGANAFSMTV